MASDTSRQHSPSGRLNTLYWLLLTVLLGLPLVSPLLRWSAVPCTHDGHLHYHRIAALRHAWENGVYFTRWMPDLAFGYGYPFFVFREAPPLYLPLIPHLLGMPLPAASNLYYALTILAAGVFMFLWVRDILGERSALVSAVAYMAAPYVLIDAYVRGNSPESLALPLFPLLLWVGRRWMLSGSFGSFFAGVLGLALLSLSHNISTFIFVPSLVVYLLALAWFVERGQGEPNEDTRTVRARVAGRLGRIVVLLGLGLGLAFFYTGGALLEMNQVTLEMSTTTRNNDWRFNFASVAEVLAPVAPEDPALVNPPLLFRLGWVPVGLALLGVSGLWWIKGRSGRAREQRLHIVLMLIAALVYLFLALPLSRMIWEALPLIDFIQFPWRFVGRAALPVGFLAGVPFAWFDYRPVARRWLPVALTAAAVGLFIVEAIPNLYPRYCVEEPFPTILTVHAYEHMTGLVGVDPEGSYFPRTVKERPTGSPLEDDYRLAGSDIRRFDETALPPGAAIQSIRYTPLAVSLVLTSPSPFTARYLSFAFPGWTARVDGEAMPITPEDPTGLITFSVPAGTHEITVAWGATPLRSALAALSLLAAVGVIAVVVFERRRLPRLVSRQVESSEAIAAGRYIPAVLLVVLLVFGIRLVNSRVDTPLHRNARPPVAVSTSVQGGELRLDGYSLDRAQVNAGQTFTIDMAWTAVAPPSADYQSEIRLVGPDGLVWSEKGSERPRIFEDAPPTRLWHTGEWGWDSREVRVLTGTPPGDYAIILTLFDKATLQPVTFVDAETGVVIGPTATLGKVTVTNSDDPQPLIPQYPLDTDVPESGLRLLGYNQDRTATAPGDAVLLTLFLQCADLAACDNIRLTLANEQGGAEVEWNLPSIRTGFPAEAWPANDYLRGQHLLTIPPALESGSYRFVLNDELSLGILGITSPERTYTSPPLAYTTETRFSTSDGTPVAALAGLAAGDQSSCYPELPPVAHCSVPLVWRAESETPVSYHVFIHLVDESGVIVAQSDGMPAGWSRPTTGWLPGEYVRDDHALQSPAQLPESSLALHIGLYNPDTGERLITAEGGDYLTIPLGSSD